MLQKLDHIKNIIFDLGGVILDIDLVKGVEALKKLRIDGLESVSTRFNQNDTLLAFEKGMISEMEFLEKIKEKSRLNIRDEDVVDAWNEIVLGFQREKIDLLARLEQSSRFRIILLSNTNVTHKKCYTQMLRDKYSINGLEDLFERTYLSHEIHMRKPDAEIYHYVLTDSRLAPEETLFIDDSEVNIKAARELGIESFHLTNGITINDLFPEQSATKWI